MATRERSPNYPGYSLDTAVDMVRKLYESEHRSAVPVEVAARALGHAGVSEKGRLSGPALAKLATLRQYGLIDNSGKGKIRVADRALDFVLHQPHEPEYRRAAQEAFNSAPLFSELYSEYAKASDNALRAHLIKERKFSEEGAGRVIRAFRDSLTFAKLEDGSYDNTGETSGKGEKTPPARPPGGAGGWGGSEQRKRQPGMNEVAYSWPLGDGNSVELTFKDEPTQANLDILLAQLQIVRQIAPTNNEPPAPPLREPERLRDLEAEEEIP